MSPENISHQRKPRVSIGMPVYNDVRFLSEALSTLLCQTFADFELIISDDGSTDGSEAVCRKYEGVDQRIRYVRQPSNHGIAWNMKFVLQEARGEFFMWAADDDRWHPTFIETLMNALLSHPEACCAFSPYNFIDEDGKPIEEYAARAYDFSSPSRLERLVKLCRYYDDGFGYALFRREWIQEVDYPVWWSVNARSSVNVIFPSLFYFLSRGDYVKAGSTPLWFNRLKKQSYHYVPYMGSRWKAKYAFILRKINVFYESLRNVYRGSSSPWLVAAILPAVFARLVYDCISWLTEPTRNRVNYWLRRESER